MSVEPFPVSVSTDEEPSMIGRSKSRSKQYRVASIMLLVTGAIFTWTILNHQAARREASKNRSRFNLKSIALALEKYEQEHQHYPETSIKDGELKPLLSWRVELLPYLGYRELHSQFDLTQPWDSEHNRKLIPRMPNIFECPEMEPGEYKTNYLLFTGIGTMFSPHGPTKKGEIIDGTSNTIMAVEADTKQAVIWTKPGDLNFNPLLPKNGFPRMRNGLGMFLMADSSVQVISHKIDGKILKELATKAGQENFTTCCCDEDDEPEEPNHTEEIDELPATDVMTRAEEVRQEKLNEQ